MSAKEAIAVVFDGNVLRPADAFAQEQMSTLQKNIRLNARLTKALPKNDFRAGLNALYWAGLHLMIENFDDADAKKWPTARKLHTLILETQGYVDRLWRIDGTYRVVPDSVAFDSMGDEDFATFVEKARAFLVGQWGWDPLDAWVKNKEQEELGAARRRLRGEQR